MLLREVLRIQGSDKIGFALLGTETKRVVLRVGRDFNRGTYFDLFSAFSNQVNDSPDQVWTDPKALQHLFVLIQDVLGDKPNEVALLCPPVENIGTGIAPLNERFPEARYAGYEHACVNDDPRLARLNFPQQR